jgi:hypothetical protein
VAIDVENRFENQATTKPSGVASDLWYFFRHSKKWWLTPVVIVMFLFGLLVVLVGNGRRSLYLHAVLNGKVA